jgi:O-antigen/teichoic acid export membrane protein/glycosyltransferase involved in cell wall biosynthesis
MTPAVSVVIATHNYGRYLRAALDSALGQTFRDTEIIIVDDGSTDDTAAVVRPYGRNARVAYHQLDRRGQPRAKNFGIQMSRAPLVAFLDADDIWLPEKLERQVLLLDADPEVGMVYSRRLLMDEEGWELEYKQPQLYRGWVLPRIFRNNFVCFSSSVVRRSVFEAVGAFDEGIGLAIDYDLWLRVALHYRVDYVDAPLVRYRTGHASLSRQKCERIRTAQEIVRRFLDERGGRESLPHSLVQRTLADLCCDMGGVVSGVERVGWFMRALWHRPQHRLAWHALLAFWWPDCMRGWARRLLGKPDWERPRRLNPVVPAPAIVDPLQTRDDEVTALESLEALPKSGAAAANRRALLLNAAASWLGFAAQVVATFFLSPILIHGLGDRRYGIWALVDSVLAYLMLFDLGVGAAVVRFVARFEAARDREELSRVFSTSVFIFSLAGAAALCIGVGMGLLGLGALGVPADLQGEARVAILLLSVNLALGLPLGVFPAVLDGLGRYPAKTLVRTAGLMVRIPLFIAIIYSGGGLVELAWMITGSNVLEHIALAVAARRYLPELRFSVSLIDRVTFRRIRGYSVNALLAMLAGRISFQTDSVVISYFLAPQFITFFAVGARLTDYVKSSLRAVTTVLTPAVSTLEARGEHATIQRMFVGGTRYVLWAVLPIQAGLMLLGLPFLKLWLGERLAEECYPVLLILSVPLALAMAQSIGGRILYGTGRLRWYGRLAILEALANLVLSVALVKPLGIEGVAWGTAIPNLLFNCILAVYVCRLLSIGIGSYFRTAFLAPCVVTAMLSTLWLGLTQWRSPQTWLELLVLGSSGAAAYLCAATFVEFGPRAVFTLARSILVRTRSMPLAIATWNAQSLGNSGVND